MADILVLITIILVIFYAKKIKKIIFPKFIMIFFKCESLLGCILLFLRFSYETGHKPVGKSKRNVATHRELAAAGKPIVAQRLAQESGYHSD